MIVIYRASVRRALIAAEPAAASALSLALLADGNRL